MKKLTKSCSVIIFFGSLVLLFLPTYLSNTVWATYAVSSIRWTPVLNPVLGIAFGWSAILGCTAGNFLSDLLSGYGWAVSLLGLISQTLYGAIPYYVWRRFVGCSSHVTRLDGPEKVLFFALLMAVDSLVIGLSVGLLQLYAAGTDLWSTVRFAALNDFDVCMILGLPLMAFLDHLYSRYLHEGRRKLSVNERVILWSAAAELLAAVVLALTTSSGGSLTARWERIFGRISTVVNALLVLSVAVMLALRGLKKKHAGLRIFERKNGTVYADEKRRLEFVTFPGKGPSRRVKCDALGCTYEAARSDGHPTYAEAWYTALSCQKGCPMKCSFCDCPGYGYHGNATAEDLAYQIDTIVENSGSSRTDWFEVGFTRMGEPLLNPELNAFLETQLRQRILSRVEAKVIFPVVSTIMPRSAKNTAAATLQELCRIKNEVYGGNAAVEISLNSTDEAVRRRIMRNMAMSLEEIGEICRTLPAPVGRKYALSFAVTKDTAVDAGLIDSLFDRDKFLIKLVPIHRTFNALDDGCTVTTEYTDFEVYRPFEEAFKALGWEVMVYLDPAEEDREGLTSGHLLLSGIPEKLTRKPREKKRIGLLVAIEMDAVFQLYPQRKELPGPFGNSLYLVDKGDYEVYILRSGMGEIAAAAAVQYLISQCKADMIVNYGVVGGLTGDMAKQKVCLVDRVVHYKYDCSEFMDLAVGQVDGHESIFIRPSESLVKNALAMAEELATVTCCSGDKFISTAEEKTYLHETFEGDICDMESAGIVLTCETNRVPCLLIKAVADGLSDGAAGFFAELQAASVKCLEVADRMMERLAGTES